MIRKPGFQAIPLINALFLKASLGLASRVERLAHGSVLVDALTSKSPRQA